MVVVARKPGTGLPAPELSAGGSIELVVLHTSTNGTLESLKYAGALAEGLGAQIRLVVLYVVPYPLGVDCPPVAIEFTQRRFRTLASRGPVEAFVDIRIGRDRCEMLDLALRPSALIVLERPRRWWPSKEAQMVKRLRKLGHQVVFSG